MIWTKFRHLACYCDPSFTDLRTLYVCTPRIQMHYTVWCKIFKYHLSEFTYYVAKVLLLFVPGDQYRPLLATVVDGHNDYINAVFLQVV